MFKPYLTRKKLLSPVRVLGMSIAIFSLLVIFMVAHSNICFGKTETECNMNKSDRKVSDLTSAPIFIYVIASSLSQDIKKDSQQ